MTQDRNEIARLLSTDREVILCELGALLATPGVVPHQPSKLKSIAQQWLSEKKEDLRVLLCKNDRIRMLVNKANTHERRVTLATAVADLIAASIIGLPPATVAVLLVLEGLDTLCGTIWHDGQQSDLPKSDT